MVLLGMIVLAGIVVNNAIVLVDYANLLTSRGLRVAEAAVAAGKVRLRPIAITTLTTLLGLLPMTGWIDPAVPLVRGVADGCDSVIKTAVEGAGRSLTAPADWALVGGKTFSLRGFTDLLIGGGQGAEVRKPLAITVVVGLTTSTALTLFFVPSLWALVNRRRDAKLLAPLG
jgi:multidrug efflux pump subunit AcrB